VATSTNYSYSWPPDYPGGCPPEDASAANGAYFRFVEHDPPQAADFVRPVHGPRGAKLDPADCGHHGLSLFAEEDDVRRMRQLVPPFAKKMVARGELEPQMGVVARTPTEISGRVLRSHHDWWVTTDYREVPPFSVVVVT
jgi:hypothetical protein